MCVPYGSTLHDVINQFAPVCQFRLKNNDKPWVTKLFKDSVDMRNKAFASGDKDLYRVLRNRVNRLRQDLQKRYFSKRVNLLKKQNNRLWWKEVKSLCGLKIEKVLMILKMYVVMVVLLIELFCLM
jgi:hypothetical protein